MSDNERAREQARAQLDFIRAVVKRLEHVRECSDEQCDLEDWEIAEGLGIYYEEGKTEITEDDRVEYHTEEDAMQVIQEDPLSLQVRSDWVSAGTPMTPEEYEILLCTGGPAVRIVGDLNEYGEPTSADLQYQDWFTRWESLHLTSGEETDLIEYAMCFYFDA